jgi:hypothetical protein
MRKVLFAIAITGSLGTFATSDIALSQGNTTVCWPGGRCYITTAEYYNRCVDLALQSGHNLSRGDRYSFNAFVYQCVAGRVRR